jgi:hypothetical protein
MALELIIWFLYIIYLFIYVYIRLLTRTALTFDAVSEKEARSLNVYVQDSIIYCDKMQSW